MSSRILLASTNRHKLEEFKLILAPHGIEVISPGELGLQLKVEETGNTFADNAVLKAEAWREVSGIPTVADDSGLVVDALGGAPGVYSARYGGANANDLDNLYLVLKRLNGVPTEKRTARFVAAIAVSQESGPTRVFQESVEGLITSEPRGDGGFGYDPIFFYPPYGRTLAEVDAVKKSEVSHRGRALARALPCILEA